MLQCSVTNGYCNAHSTTLDPIPGDHHHCDPPFYHLAIWLGAAFVDPGVGQQSVPDPGCQSTEHFSGIPPLFLGMDLRANRHRCSPAHFLLSAPVIRTAGIPSEYQCSDRLVRTRERKTATDRSHSHSTGTVAPGSRTGSAGISLRSHPRLPGTGAARKISTG